MLLVYGPYMPFRLLEEVRHWKMKEREQTVIIREIIPHLEPDYANMLREWEPVFANTEQCAELWMQSWLHNTSRLPVDADHQLRSLVEASRAQSEAFVRQLLYVRQYSSVIHHNAVAPIVIDHVIRESQYFLTSLDALSAQGIPETVEGSGQLVVPGAADVTAEPELARPEELTTAAEPEPSLQRSSLSQGSVPIGGHRLPPLPYAYNALEPYIDEATMRLHHSKHHQSYVDGLNNAEKALEEARKSDFYVNVKHWERELAFHGAGHYLHTIFWQVMTPGGSKPSGSIVDAIKSSFGSFEAFKKHFSEAAEKVEGGGWAILVWSPRSRRLEILQAEKHQNLSQWDVIPLLPLDVWEHAYYLKHQNKRADYIKDWWNVVNWPHVNERFEAASKLKW